MLTATPLAFKSGKNGTRNFVTSLHWAVFSVADFPVPEDKYLAFQNSWLKCLQANSERSPLPYQFRCNRNSFPAKEQILTERSSTLSSGSTASFISPYQAATSGTTWEQLARNIPGSLPLLNSIVTFSGRMIAPHTQR